MNFVMESREITRREIEEKVSKMGDYVKIDYLERCLKQNLDFDTKKFVMIQLAKIYETKNMFSEAGKLMKNAADINTTFKGKTSDFLKSTELFIKGGDFDEAEMSFKRALASCGTENEKVEVKNNVREFYKIQAQSYLKKDKRKHAMQTYEKILSSFEVNSEEKSKIQKELLELYSKLGKVKEYYNLKSSMDRV